MKKELLPSVKTRIKTTTILNWIFRSLLLVVFSLPTIALAEVQLHFEWDPNVEPDIAGYRVYSRLATEDYDYDQPDWEGQDAYCSLWIDNENAAYFFVVRAYDLDGFESDDSNEIAYTPAGSPPPEDPPSEELPLEDPPSEDPLPKDPSPEDPPPEDPSSDDPPSEDPPSEDLPPEDLPGHDPDNLLVIDAATGWGQVYLYVDECIGVAAVDEFSAMDENTVEDFIQRSDDLFLGLIRIELTVKRIGGKASIPIDSSEPMGDNIRWYTHEGMNGWQDYSDHSFFSDDFMSVVLEFEDGGYGDADGAENGVIVCTSGPVRSMSSTYRYSEPGASPSESDGGCFINAIFPILNAKH